MLTLMMMETMNVKHCPADIRRNAHTRRWPGATEFFTQAASSRPNIRNNLPKAIHVTPIQTRSPSPERVAILPPPTPAPHAAGGSSRAPVSPMQTSTGSEDVALALRKDRQQFYVKVASAARSGVKMDFPKPQLRPPIQPPGLFYLMACGLLKFNLECGELQAFQEVVQNPQNDPSFMDRLWAAYGRFHTPFHQVQPIPPCTHAFFLLSAILGLRS